MLYIPWILKPLERSHAIPSKSAIVSWSTNLCQIVADGVFDGHQSKTASQIGRVCVYHDILVPWYNPDMAHAFGMMPYRAFINTILSVRWNKILTLLKRGIDIIKNGSIDADDLQPDVRLWLSALNTFVFSGYREGFPNYRGRSNGIARQS